jgi:hypothetical protein
MDLLESSIPRAKGLAHAETFLRSPGRRLLPVDLIERKGLVGLKSTRSLKVVELHGPGLATLGATAQVTATAPPYDLPQAWAAALYNHPGLYDGIAYRARHDDGEICYAFFDRSAPALAEIDREEGLLGAPWFSDLLSRYAIGIAPR